MDEEELKVINFKIQDMLFKNSSNEEVINYMNSKNLSINAIFEYLIQFIQNEDYSHTIDNLLSLIDKLIKWDYYKIELKDILIIQGENENLFFIKYHIIKKYVINFINHNIDIFHKHEFLVKFIKVYLIDENTGVYNQISDLLFSLYFKFNDYFTNNKLFHNVISYLDTHSSNSIILIRELELIIRFINNYDDKEIDFILKRLSNKFYNYDLLTKLTFLDTLETVVQKEKIIDIFLSEIKFFQNLSNDYIQIPNELMRKILYSFSKFYANKFVSEQILKNSIAVAIQYYDDNKTEIYFIISFLQNIFINKDIFSFLAKDENNSEFDFNNNIINVIIENYYNHDPDIKKNSLELLSLIGNFTIPSLVQEIFLKKFYTLFYKSQFSNYPKSENESMKFFIDKLFKDFKNHDFIDYEIKFLETTLSLATYDSITKKLISNFDFMLYLLNRRERPQDICLLKFKIVEKLSKSDIADIIIVQQLSKYIEKGPF